MHKSNDEHIMRGRCATCMKPVSLKHDLIFVDKDGCDFEALADAQGDEVAPEQEVETPDADGTDVDEAINKNPKLCALYEIINGRVPEQTEKVANMHIAKLLTGTRDIVAPRDAVRKVLVFANFDESLSHVIEFLDEHNIKHLQLRGTHREMSNTIESFRSGDAAVLLINSQRNCAGLNIQFATDVVFYHKILDQNIESQVAGRAQRIGREYNLNIWYLLYMNEEKFMAQQLGK